MTHLIFIFLMINNFQPELKIKKIIYFLSFLIIINIICVLNIIFNFNFFIQNNKQILSIKTFFLKINIFLFLLIEYYLTLFLIKLQKKIFSLKKNVFKINKKILNFFSIIFIIIIFFFIFLSKIKQLIINNIEFLMVFILTFCIKLYNYII